MSRRVITVVADGVGIGGAADAIGYGTPGADTLGNLARHLDGLHLPTLERWGLGSIAAIEGVPATSDPEAVVSRLVEESAGNDTPTGHWELAGLVTTTAPPTFPDGFPTELLDLLAERFGTGRGADMLGNCAENGEAIIARLGPAHLSTGQPIVYTSADSVLQIAAHSDMVPLERLYEWCAQAREVLDERWPVGRVIARPFTGSTGSFERRAERRDWALPAPGVTACDLITAAGVDVVGVGKIGDIFAHRGVTKELHPGGNQACMAATEVIVDELIRDDRDAFVFVNLVDFDSRWGHSRKPEPFADALVTLDRWLGELSARVGDEDLIVVTADHGNDPTYLVGPDGAPHNDHTRENVPFLAHSRALRGRVVPPSPMAAVGPAVCQWLDVEHDQLAYDPIDLEGSDR